MQIAIYIITAAVGACLGLIAAAAIFSHGRKRRGRRGAANAPHRLEFSKVVLLLVMATYFVGVVIGVKVVLIDFSQLGVLLTFIGAPTATAIVFYAWKAKAENIVKIKKANPEAVENSVDLGSL